MNFENFSFSPAIVEGIKRAGYLVPTPIQMKAIPEVMKGRDVMGLAQTGTGKTAAFALPVLERLAKGPRGVIRALVVAPTRELAEQTHGAFQTLGRQTRLQSASVYGGVGIAPQIRALKNADIVAGCPGRLLDHINRRTIDLSRLEVLILDEADQMFDMGFFPDIRRIISHLPGKNRQTLLFSATMPEDIRRLANEVLRNPTTVRIGLAAPPETVSHALFPVAQHLKTALLIKLIDFAGTRSVLVFTRTKSRAKILGEKLARAGYRTASLQGNLSQGRRQEALDSFRSGKFQILVATDIASRGIDIANVSHVINFDIPATPEAYIHRVGRTGRAERDGEAFTLITKDDDRMVKAINKAVGATVEQRKLADFDYDAPGASPEKTNNAASKRPRSYNQQRTPSPKFQERSAPKFKERSGPKFQERSIKGTFTWMSPNKNRSAGGPGAR